MDRREPSWLTVAGYYLGTKEVPGGGSNPKIIGWAQRLGGWIRSYFTSDAIPWCALFVNACLDEVRLPGTKSLAAKSFETYGIKLDQPVLGAILVFTRDGGGHVGFYVGETATRYRVRGGNQGDAVSDTWIAKARLTAIRWPGDVASQAALNTAQQAGRIFMAEDGAPLSTNEA